MSSTINQEEAAVSKKVEGLMLALDQVKKYKAFSKLLIDFAMIILGSIVLLFAVELAVNYYRLASGSTCYFFALNSFACETYVSSASIWWQLVGFSVLLIPAAGLLVGIFWVDRKLRAVRGGEWRDLLKEGFPGALRLLEDMDWDSVFDDMQVSKIGYVLYSLIKILGYWILAFIGLFFPFSYGELLLHTSVNFYTPALVSLILVLVLTRRDLAKRYRQVVSMDAIMWELRWFSSEFRRAEFEATKL